MTTCDPTPIPPTRREIGYALFDMDNDRNETTDVKDQHPDVAEPMKHRAEQMRADLGDQGKPGPGIRPAGQLGAGDERLKW